MTTVEPEWMMSSFSDWEYDNITRLDVTCNIMCTHDNMTREEAERVVESTRRTTTLTALEK